MVTITVVAVICYGLEQGSATSFLEGKGTGSKYFRLSVSHVSVAYAAWFFVFTIF